MSAEQLNTLNRRREVIGHAQSLTLKALKLVLGNPLSSKETKFEHQSNQISWRWMSLSGPRGRDLIPESVILIDSRQALSSNSSAMYSNIGHPQILKCLSVMGNLVFENRQLSFEQTEISRS
ncbi:hypothetical protein ES332_D05G435400v1 [Gossypium tomentosum]|uniref:Uncharacterized protein n=1 Tax=Gossypium tomentosum TaxID=34277 RepID=A0A5D2L723_GOSTO|nr:hypothetical protein ES332_D05G435400v1 [Gossypium tomentosum]